MAAEVSALLPVHVVNTDDHLPYFPHSLKTHSAELTLSLPTGEFNRSSSTDMEQRRSLGHVQAVDEDSAPFNRGFYSIVPKCSNPHPDQSHVSVDKDTGELFIASVDGQIWPEADQAIRICVLISSSELDLAELARLSRHDLAAHPESLLHLQILPEPPRIRPIPARLIRANNSRQLLSRQLIDQRVAVAEDEEAAEGVGSGFKLALDSLEFVAYGQNKAQRVGALQALRPLVAISPADARLRFDPAIRDALMEDGMYRFGISLTDKGTGEAVDTIFKNVHFLEDKHRLRFVFDESIHSVGANLTKFLSELESALSSKYRIANSEPARDPAKPNRRTSMCFHLWAPDSGAIVVLDEAVRAISTHVPELQQHNRPLAELYIRFGIINIEPCELDSAGPMLNSSPVLHAESKQYLAGAIAACTLALVLFACGTYACCVRRMQRKRGMLLQDEQRSASDNPYSIYPSAAGNVHNNTTSNSVFSVPEFIQTKQILGEELDYW